MHPTSDDSIVQIMQSVILNVIYLWHQTESTRNKGKENVNFVEYSRIELVSPRVLNLHNPFFFNEKKVSSFDLFYGIYWWNRDLRRPYIFNYTVFSLLNVDIRHGSKSCVWVISFLLLASKSDWKAKTDEISLHHSLTSEKEGRTQQQQQQEKKAFLLPPMLKLFQAINARHSQCWRRVKTIPF